MGNSHGNPCQELGFEGKTIGTAELEGLWAKYDKDGNGRLDEKETVSFLLDFGSAVGSAISKRAAKDYYRAHCASKEGLTKVEFFALFVDIAHAEAPAAGRIEMTSSLMEAGGQMAFDVIDPSEMLVGTPPVSEMADSHPPMSEMADSHPPMSEMADSLPPPMSELASFPFREQQPSKPLREMPSREVMCDK